MKAPSVKKLPPLVSWFRLPREPTTPCPSHLANTKSVLHSGRGQALSLSSVLGGRPGGPTGRRGPAWDKSATHSEERVPGVLEDPALGDRVGDFILQTEAG